MPHKVMWSIENALITSVLWGEMSLEELKDILAENLALIANADATWVHVINDTCGITSTPSLAQLVKAVRGYKPHTRTGWVTVIRNASPILSFISDVGLQAVGIKVRTVRTTADAITFLQSVDDHIDRSLLPADFYQYDTHIAAVHDPVL